MMQMTATEWVAVWGREGWLLRENTDWPGRAWVVFDGEERHFVRSILPFASTDFGATVRRRRSAMPIAPMLIVSQAESLSTVGF
ncbi:MAG: hypothetical protein AB7I68_14000 [Porticoccaceae bacterium]